MLRTGGNRARRPPTARNQPAVPPYLALCSAGTNLTSQPTNPHITQSMAPMDPEKASGADEDEGLQERLAALQELPGCCDELLRRKLPEDIQTTAQIATRVFPLLDNDPKWTEEFKRYGTMTNGMRKFVQLLVHDRELRKALAKDTKQARMAHCKGMLGDSYPPQDVIDKDPFRAFAISLSHYTRLTISPKRASAFFDRPEHQITKETKQFAAFLAACKLTWPPKSSGPLPGSVLLNSLKPTTSGNTPSKQQQQQQPRSQSTLMLLAQTALNPSPQQNPQQQHKAPIRPTARPTAKPVQEDSNKLLPQKRSLEDPHQNQEGIPLLTSQQRSSSGGPARMSAFHQPLADSYHQKPHKPRPKPRGGIGPYPSAFQQVPAKQPQQQQQQQPQWDPPAAAAAPQGDKSDPHQQHHPPENHQQQQQQQHFPQQPQPQQTVMAKLQSLQYTFHKSNQLQAELFRTQTELFNVQSELSHQLQEVQSLLRMEIFNASKLHASFAPQPKKDDSAEEGGSQRRPDQDTRTVVYPMHPSSGPPSGSVNTDDIPTYHSEIPTLQTQMFWPSLLPSMANLLPPMAAEALRANPLAATVIDPQMMHPAASAPAVSAAATVEAVPRGDKELPPKKPEEPQKPKQQRPKQQRPKQQQQTKEHQQPTKEHRQTAAAIPAARSPSPRSTPPPRSPPQSVMAALYKERDEKLASRNGERAKKTSSTATASASPPEDDMFYSDNDDVTERGDGE